MPVGIRKLFSTVLVSLGVMVGVLAVVASPVRAEEHCGNEALRGQLNSTALPECRAYEMLSPVYKGGGTGTVEQYASNGERALFTSEGLFAGDPGEGEAVGESAVYLDTRTATGWQATPLNAPLSEFVGQLPIAGEIENGETLWDQHTPEQSAATRGLYIRTEQGEYKYVGRLNPVPGGEEESSVIQTSEKDYDRPVASTSNFGHVVIFASEAEDYWKKFDGTNFDGTKGNAGSLYEYSGIDNSRPTLVGVEGEKGSNRLVGECGAQLGSGIRGSEYNALSADGESVIFTVEPEGVEGCPAGAKAPAYQEIYMRVHGSDASTAKAETIYVSANQCTSECGSESGKQFEGASENDEKLFFASTQKLTNNATDGTESGDAGDASEGGHCNGAREHGGCNLYEFDFEPANGHDALHLIAGGDEVLGVLAIAANGERVYFVARKALAKDAQEGEDNLYVYDTATKVTSFIATLVENDEGDWRESQPGRDVEAAGANGQYLLFSSEAQLIPGETSSTNQVYEYDAETGELVRVSKGELVKTSSGAEYFDDDGLSANSDYHIFEETEFAKKFRTGANLGKIAENGGTVVFESTGELSPRATSATAATIKPCSSVYEFRTPDRGQGPISQGEVHLISDGRDVQPHKSSLCGATPQGMDGEGENILFATADPLLSSDTNGFQRDIYDARVEGGFPPFVSSAACEGGCEGVVSAPPVFGAPASASLMGSGNLVAPVPAAVVRSKPKAKMRAGKLEKALRVCHADKGKAKRGACEKNARKRYGPPHKAKAKGGKR